MVINPQQYLERVASLLKVPLGEIVLTENSVCTRVVGINKIAGVINIIISLLNESNSTLGGTDFLEQIEIQQWIEYCIVYAVHTDSPQNLNTILNQLNEILSTKTYLVSQRLTIADVVLYYILSNSMDTLSNLEKEKYINVSRWFDNLQQDAWLRQSNKLVDFSTNYLVGVAPPGRH